MTFGCLGSGMLATAVICVIGLKKVLLGNACIDYFSFWIWGHLGSVSKNVPKNSFQSVVDGFKRRGGGKKSRFFALRQVIILRRTIEKL